VVVEFKISFLVNIYLNLYYLPFSPTHATIPLSGLMVIIIRHFLVDSENVNDNWLMLFDMADEDDEIVVFSHKNLLNF